MNFAEWRKQNPEADSELYRFNVLIKVPSEGRIFNVYEGDGESLTEDMENEGYKDYYLYEEYNSDGVVKDGGECFCEEPIRDHCKDEEDFARFFLRDQGFPEDTAFVMLDDEARKELGLMVEEGNGPCL